MMSKPPRSPQGLAGRDAGFTLFEVLAALALASLIFVVLNLAMTTIERSVAASRTSLGNQDALETAARIFTRDVARIAVIRRPGTGAPGFLFEGTARQMIYPLPETEGVSRGGLYWVRLRIVTRQGVTQLIRDRAPLPPGGDLRLPGTWDDEVVLLEGRFDIAFSYRAQRSGSRAWADGWTGAEAMPQQVKLTIAEPGTGQLRIPVLVQSLLIDAEAQCAAAAADCDGEMPKSEAQ